MSKKNVRLESLLILSEIISLSSNREKIKQNILSDSIDWLSVVEIANTHFLTAALYYSLLDKDLLNFIDDEELLTYLEQIYTINLHRNQKIIEQSKEIAGILLKKDIKPVFLKGSASLLQNDYKDVGIEEAKAIIQSLIHEVKSVNGTFISLWHNESLSDQDRWKGWREVYTYLLSKIHSS